MELDSEKIKTFKNFYQNLRLGIDGDLNKALARYSKQGDNPDESVFYMEQFDNLDEELDLVPRLLRLDVGYFNLYMVRDEDYKNLFKFGMFDYYYHYVDIFYYYNICSYLYPKRVPKISDNLFAELVEYSKEREERLFKK